MTRKLDRAIAAIRRLPADRQDELAEALEAAAADSAGYTAEQIAAIDEGLADAEAGRFADPAEIDALFARHRSG